MVSWEGRRTSLAVYFQWSTYRVSRLTERSAAAVIDVLAWAAVRFWLFDLMLLLITESPVDSLGTFRHPDQSRTEFHKFSVNFFWNPPLFC